MIWRIGKFQLRKVLGKSPSGTVYIVARTFSRQDVALKILDQLKQVGVDFARVFGIRFVILLVRELPLSGRAIRDAVAKQDLQEIANQRRAMRRRWVDKNLDGLSNGDTKRPP